MPFVPFPEYLKGQGLSFGLEAPFLLRILDDCRRGLGVAEAMDDVSLRDGTLTPIHMLTMRRAGRKYLGLERDVEALDLSRIEIPVRDRLGLAASRWVGRQADVGPAVLRRRLSALVGLARATLKRGGLHLHVKQADDPRLGDLEDLAGRSIDCADLPAHRWFKLSRAVSEGLLWLELKPPAQELHRLLGPNADKAEIELIQRAVDKPVLDAIGERAQDEVIQQAAQGMLDLLGRAPCPLPLAGGLLERRGISVYALLEEKAPGEAAEFTVKDMAGLGTWLKARGVQALGLARKDAISGAAWIRQLSQVGVVVEWVRMAGVMKQARAASGALRQQAARVVAERLADPLRGYLDLLPDELGLGEYLDRVDSGLLRLALEDARQLALWLRENGTQVAATVRGAAVNPLVGGLDDLHPGMEFAGTVVNLTGFGAFVELGLDVQGLVHLSELSTKFLRHPSEVVSVGQRVRVRVVEVDQARGRLSLSMKETRAEVTRKGRPKRVESLKALDELFKKG